MAEQKPSVKILEQEELMRMAEQKPSVETLEQEELMRMAEQKPSVATLEQEKLTEQEELVGTAEIKPSEEIAEVDCSEQDNITELEQVTAEQEQIVNLSEQSLLLVSAVEEEPLAVNRNSPEEIIAQKVLDTSSEQQDFLLSSEEGSTRREESVRIDKLEHSPATDEQDPLKQPLSSAEQEHSLGTPMQEQDGVHVVGIADQLQPIRMAEQEHSSQKKEPGVSEQKASTVRCIGQEELDQQKPGTTEQKISVGYTEKEFSVGIAGQEDSVVTAEQEDLSSLEIDEHSGLVDADLAEGQESGHLKKKKKKKAKQHSFVVLDIPETDGFVDFSASLDSVIASKVPDSPSLDKLEKMYGLSYERLKMRCVQASDIAGTSSDTANIGILPENPSEGELKVESQSVEGIEGKKRRKRKKKKVPTATLR